MGRFRRLFCILVVPALFVTMLGWGCYAATGRNSSASRADVSRAGAHNTSTQPKQNNETVSRATTIQKRAKESAGDRVPQSASDSSDVVARTATPRSHVARRNVVGRSDIISIQNPIQKPSNLPNGLKYVLVALDSNLMVYGPLAKYVELSGGDGSNGYMALLAGNDGKLPNFITLVSNLGSKGINFNANEYYHETGHLQSAAENITGDITGPVVHMTGSPQSASSYVQAPAHAPVNLEDVCDSSNSADFVGTNMANVWSTVKKNVKLNFGPDYHNDDIGDNNVSGGDVILCGAVLSSNQLPNVCRVSKKGYKNVPDDTWYLIDCNDTRNEIDLKNDVIQVKVDTVAIGGITLTTNSDNERITKVYLVGTTEGSNIKSLPSTLGRIVTYKDSVTDKEKICGIVDSGGTHIYDEDGLLQVSTVAKDAGLSFLACPEEDPNAPAPEEETPAADSEDRPMPTSLAPWADLQLPDVSAGYDGFGYMYLNWNYDHSFPSDWYPYIPVRRLKFKIDNTEACLLYRDITTDNTANEPVYRPYDLLVGCIPADSDEAKCRRYGQSSYHSWPGNIIKIHGFNLIDPNEITIPALKDMIQFANTEVNGGVIAVDITTMCAVNYNRGTCYTAPSCKTTQRIPSDTMKALVSALSSANKYGSCYSPKIVNGSGEVVWSYSSEEVRNIDSTDLYLYWDNDPSCGFADAEQAPTCGNPLTDYNSYKNGCVGTGWKCKTGYVPFVGGVSRCVQKSKLGGDWDSVMALADSIGADVRVANMNDYFIIFTTQLGNDDNTNAEQVWRRGSGNYAGYKGPSAYQGLWAHSLYNYTSEEDADAFLDQHLHKIYVYDRDYNNSALLRGMVNASMGGAASSAGTDQKYFYLINGGYTLISLFTALRNNGIDEILGISTSRNDGRYKAYNCTQNADGDNSCTWPEQNPMVIDAAGRSRSLENSERSFASNGHKGYLLTPCPAGSDCVTIRFSAGDWKKNAVSGQWYGWFSADAVNCKSNEPCYSSDFHKFHLNNEDFDGVYETIGWGTNKTTKANFSDAEYFVYEVGADGHNGNEYWFAGADLRDFATSKLNSGVNDTTLYVKAQKRKTYCAVNDTVFSRYLYDGNNVNHFPGHYYIYFDSESGLCGFSCKGSGDEEVRGQWNPRQDPGSWFQVHCDYANNDVGCFLESEDIYSDTCKADSTVTFHN